LIFKDTLLSLVSSIQITTQNLICDGDWIEAPAFGADGDVVDIALHNITVQNWDKTVSIIPTAHILDKGFKNWRSMSESGGRRIKRQIFIDIRSVRFLTDEDVESLKSLTLLSGHLERRHAEIKIWNAKHCGQERSVGNGRALTNLGCFRAYVEAYLKDHPSLHSDGGMTFLVRQLQHTDKGVPLEVYVFCKDTRWTHYEGIQADIFDHIFAVLHRFDLKVFQSISGELNS
jgi:miniconductance mechanosensitive channel